MDVSDGVADLHLHTDASDGTCSVADRVEQARERGLDAIAVTDHDTISEDVKERVTHSRDVELIAGVEVRADVRDTKVELLGYYVDPHSSQLTSVLERVRRYRRERNRQIVDRLHDVTSLDRSYEEIRSRADGILGRPHIADILVEDGVVDSVGGAFDRYLGASGAAFVPMERVPATDVVGAIQDASGIVSLAHPGRIRTTDVGEIVEGLVTDGLDAIEVRYPYAEAPVADYAGVTVADAADLAEAFDLLRTGGSDCHGPGSGKFRVGDVRVPCVNLDALRDRAATRHSL
jgi:predicted metal-dependent phosphoesterase TrpH